MKEWTNTLVYASAQMHAQSAECMCICNYMHILWIWTYSVGYIIYNKCISGIKFCTGLFVADGYKTNLRTEKKR